MRLPLVGIWLRFVRSYIDGNPLRIAATYVRNRARFRAVANPLKVIWVDPSEIVSRLSVPPGQAERWRYGLIHGGNWDRASLRSAHDQDKQRSMRQRYVDQVPWAETELFRDRYAPQLAEGQPVKGQRTVDSLVRYYEDVYDSLFEDMSRRGLVGPTLSEPRPTYIEVHIGRDGQLIGTSNGNHRLGMANALGLRRIPVRVATRHEDWQRRRERLALGGNDAGQPCDHPDLVDICVRRNP
jgi:hypothetical protein